MTRSRRIGQAVITARSDDRRSARGEAGDLPRSRVDQVLAGTGCEALFEKA